jgi:uncharacterized membrane protein
MNTQGTTPERDESTVEFDPVVERATTVFRAGFRGSAAFLIVGIGLIVFRSQSLPPHLAPLDEVMSGLLEGSAASFIALGILVMILTPVVSTTTICLTFFQKRDQRYARLSGLVLLILILSISLSLR